MNGENRIQLEKKEEKATQPKKKIFKTHAGIVPSRLGFISGYHLGGGGGWDRNYYVVSLLLILYTMIPFFWHLRKENRRRRSWLCWR